MIALPAGNYWIGDPCYAVKDENWIPLLKSTDYLRTGDFTYGNKQCWCSETAYGDGVYIDQYGNEYPVDAGIVGIMPLDVCDGDSMNGGNIFTFDEEFQVYESGGKFNFGTIVIDTDGDE